MKSLSSAGGYAGKLLRIFGSQEGKIQWQELYEMQKEINQGLEGQLRDLSHRSEQMVLFGKLAEMLQASSRLDELSKVVSVFIRDLFPAEAGGLYFMNRSTRVMELQNNWGDTPMAFLSAFPSEHCWAVRRGNHHYQENRVDGVYCGHAQEPVPGFTLCLPLSDTGGVLGLLICRLGKTIPVCQRQTRWWPSRWPGKFPWVCPIWN